MGIIKEGLNKKMFLKEKWVLEFENTHFEKGYPLILCIIANNFWQFVNFTIRIWYLN